MDVNATKRSKDLNTHSSNNNNSSQHSSFSSELTDNPLPTFHLESINSPIHDNNTNNSFKNKNNNNNISKNDIRHTDMHNNMNDNHVFDALEDIQELSDDEDCDI